MREQALVHMCAGRMKLSLKVNTMANYGFGVGKDTLCFIVLGLRRSRLVNECVVMKRRGGCTM